LYAASVLKAAFVASIAPSRVPIAKHFFQSFE
jgi:hypothetical protein